MAELFDKEFLRKLELLSLRARRAYRGQMHGEQRSSRTGSSVEFADYRQYAPGDDFRRIDWNAYARFEHLFLKLFREEEDLHLYLLLDGSASMGFGRPSKFDYIRRLAGALAYVALGNSDRVSILLAGSREDSPAPILDSIGPRRGGAAIYEVFEFLTAAEPQGQTNLESVVRYMLARKDRPGLVVICSDLLMQESFESAVQLLSYEKFQTMLVHVLSREEISPELQGDLRLTDSETGAHVDVSTGKRVLEFYQRNLRTFLANSANLARRCAADYMLAPTETPLEELVLQWMRRADWVK